MMMVEPNINGKDYKTNQYSTSFQNRKLRSILIPTLELLLSGGLRIRVSLQVLWVKFRRHVCSLLQKK